MTGVGIIRNDIATGDERLGAAVKHVQKCTQRWLLKRLNEGKDAGPLHITVWSKDANRLKEMLGSSDEPFRDITPELPKPSSTPIKPVGLWDTFNDFAWTTRIFLVASLLSGLLALTYLWATDANIDIKVGSYDLKRPDWLQPYNTEWLHSHAYIPSVLAGATGFLIGAPFALIVLATFSVQREEKAALDRVNKLSALAWGKFRDSVFDLCTQERMFTGLNHAAYQVRQIHDQIFGEYQRRIAIAQTRNPEGGFHGAPDDEVAEFQQYLRDRSDVMNDYMSRTLSATASRQYCSAGTARSPLAAGGALMFYCGSNSMFAPRDFDDPCSSNMPPRGVSVGTSNDNGTVAVPPGPIMVSSVSVHRAAVGSTA